MYCVDGPEAVSVDKRSTVGTDGCHVGEIFFQSLAKALNKTIIVYADTPGYAVEYLCSNADAPILRVGYVNDNHYVGILHSSVVSDDMTTIALMLPVHENVTLTVANEASKPLKVNYILTMVLWLTILL